MHFLYKLLGHFICRLLLIFWNIYDFINPPKTESILFVAHPDDDTLFFHSFIREKIPYVVLLFSGWSLRRMIGFFKVMNKYNVRYRAYDTLSSNAYTSIKRRKLTEKYVKKCLSIKQFKLCATHNSDGEYGHSTHKLVHEVVVNIISNNIPIVVPVKQNEINNYPLPDKILKEKEFIFKKFYNTESWVIDQYSIWFKNEKLINIYK